MKRIILAPAIALALIVGACNDGEKQEAKKTASNENNPLLQASELPYGTANFDAIEDSDFQPAMEKGMEEQMEEIEKIANNPEPATFENTLVAMEKSGQTLNRVSGIFNLLASANTNPTLQEIQEEEAPKLAAHQDKIFLNDKLFQRVKSLYEKLDSLQLDKESKRLVEYYYQRFQLAGANLNEDDKTALKKLNEEEAKLSAQFTNRLLAATKESAFLVDDLTKLAGLPENEVQAARENAEDNGYKQKFLLTLQNTTQQPALQSLKNRETRKALFENSWNRAEHGDSTDTRKIVARLAEIRADQAKLLGFKNFAEWKLQNQMAKNPENVKEFLSKLVPAARKKVKAEAEEIRKMISKEGENFELQPWDWNYYSEKVRKAKYDLDESQVKPYFELDNVVKNGVFYAAHELYGISFKERTDLPVYQEDVKVYEVFDADSSSIGLFYTDYFKRDNKSGGAWMDNIVGQSKLLDTKPVVYNVTNFTKPAPGQPALISFDDVSTLFHEFGHALHGLFASQQYPSLSGTNTARDFVEFPSQFNEHWATYPKVFKNYAKHYKTGELMPQELVDKIKKSSTFNQGYSLTELLAAASLDMQWHTIAASDSIKNVDEFEKEALKRTNLALEVVPPRYRSSYFLHIWGNGYAAGYYAYLWTEMLNDDAYTWFEEHGGLTRENGDRFRKMILSKGNTEDYAEMFLNFRGHEPDITPMLTNRGLIKI
ncbi:peptidyl-dipeptidase Dcp [Christiangramia fulva]|uniref:Dipeptidyl carboxypeptidase n=1 Tax=Christiangramia fulva TaxID=2126553 RepID=A0A2R3Z9R0_9FLAO|nr:peptidyl-dipeptidase Dcp [Christiangramia fulva]AVR47028.1 peptidyl-dipeptidase Dcp [Christiangramia fulva]